MFETFDWDEEIPKKSEKNVISSLKRKIEKSVSSPSLTQNLIDDTPEKVKKAKTENILTKGIKFASEQDFLGFLNSRDKKSEKRKLKKSESKSSLATPTSSEQKPKTEQKFKVSKLKELFKNEEKPGKSEENVKNPHKVKLQSAHFRHLNEKLYTQSGSNSLKMFQKDPKAFEVYHEGFMSQASKWPVDPLAKIITSIMKMSGTLEIADFGCGEARLAKALQDSSTVHSFDLVKVNDLVTVCDFAHTPLENDSCDVVVFCLSLMGTNLKDFVKEANRVLKVGGVIKIAEVVSRFKDLSLEDFIQIMVKCGFQLKWKDKSNDYFYLMDFKKVKEMKSKVSDFSLKPCVYKKR